MANVKDVRIGEGLILTPFRAAVLGNLAFIADLHIGLEEASLVTSRLQTARMLEAVEELVSVYDVDTVVFAGDIKHSFGKQTSQEWSDIVTFFSRVSELVKPIVLKGNHDFYIQNILSKLDISVGEVYEDENVVCHHGHLTTWKETKLLIVGNEHPALLLRDDVGAKIKLPVYLWFEKEAVLILPAFNPLARGTDVRELKKHHLNPVLNFMDFEKARVFAIEDEGKEVLDFLTIKDLETWEKKRRGKDV